MRRIADLDSIRMSGQPLLELPLVNTLTLAFTSTADTEGAVGAAAQWQVSFIRQWEVRMRWLVH